MMEKVDLSTELDSLIARLSGVLAAKTVVDDHGDITEIHVLSDLTKSPKQLVRDVQSALMSAHGLDLDYKLISVAQVNSELMVPDEQEDRLQIKRITVSLDSYAVETTVTLTRGQEQFEGSGKSALASKNRLYAAVEACLEAIRLYLGPSYGISLLDMQRQRLGGEDCFILSLLFTEPFQETVLFGIAGIKRPDTEVQSAVMAVLSALNRFMGRPRGKR